MIFIQQQDCLNYEVYNGSKPRRMTFHSNNGLCNAHRMKRNKLSANRRQVRANDMRPGTRVFKADIQTEWKEWIVPSLSIPSWDGVS